MAVGDQLGVARLAVVEQVLACAEYPAASARRQQTAAAARAQYLDLRPGADSAVGGHELFQFVGIGAQTRLTSAPQRLAGRVAFELASPLRNQCECVGLVAQVKQGVGL